MYRMVSKQFRSLTRWGEREDSKEKVRRGKLEENQEKEMKKRGAAALRKEGGFERTNLWNEREGVELGTGDAHEVGVLLAEELGICEEFVLRMVEAFFYFDKVSVTFGINITLSFIMMGSWLVFV